MNPSFFGLEGHPFEREGDAGEAFLSEGHEALCAELHAGLKAPHGITLLIGEEGSGKTTLARSFAEQLADSATVAYLPTVGPGLRHLLTEIIEQLGGTESGAGEEQVLLNELARLARARAEHGRTTLIILDDAHELPAKTIERLGKLFGDDPADPSLLHIILVGRGELLDRMNAANDRSILKHLVQVCRMDPIGPEESFRYIADRIAKVGGVVDSIFTPDALHMIVQRANGFPARIDALCSASLECAEDRGEASVDTDAVDVACAGPTNTERFEFDDVAPGEDEESATPSYFLVDDGEESGADGSDTIERQSGGESLRARVSAMTENRKRMALWAVGLVGVVAAFAAVLTSTDTEEPAAVAPATPPVEIAVATPAEDATPERALASEPAAVPNLTLSKPVAKPTSEADGEPAGAAVRERRQRELEALQGEAKPSRATAPVHAAPSGPVAEPVEIAAGAAATATQPNAAEIARREAADARPRVRSPQPAAEQTAPPQAASIASPVPTASASKPVQPTASADVKPTLPTPQPTTVVKRVVTAPASPEPARVATAAQPLAAVLPSRYFTVQVGAFGSRKNAETLLAKVRGEYSDGRIMTVTSGGKPVFRVVSGTFDSMDDAKGRATALTGAGFNTYVRAVNQ